MKRGRLVNVSIPNDHIIKILRRFMLVSYNFSAIPIHLISAQKV